MIRDRASGEAATVRAKYVIGADGGRSFVGQQAGIGMEGETGLGYAVNVWFEADLTKYREHRPGTLFFSVQPGRDVWLDSGTFITVRARDEWVLIVMYDPAVEQIDLGEDAMMERGRKNIGDDSVEIRIKNISLWQIHHVLAETYRKGRAALEDFFADTPSGEKRHDEVQKVLDDADCQFNAHGVEMNQRYTSSAVLEDGPMLAFVHDHEFVHRPLVHPGAVVPRVWLKQDGRRVSTIGLVGRGRFTLLTGIGGAPWREAVRVVGEELGLQIAVHGIGAGQDLADPTAELRAALHSILGTPARDAPYAQNAPARGELLTEGA